MVTTKGKPIVDTQKKKNKSKHTTKGNCQIRKDSKRGKKRIEEIQNSQKTMNKVAGVSPYFSVITLNENELIFLIKRHRMEGHINNETQLYTASREPLPALKTHVREKGCRERKDGRDILWKWKRKEHRELYFSQTKYTLSQKLF